MSLKEVISRFYRHQPSFISGTRVSTIESLVMGILSLRRILREDVPESLASQENPYFQRCTQTLEKVRHQWIIGIDLEKKLDLRYREEVSKELEDLGQVDDEREWKESLSETDEPLIDSRDFKDEVRILRGIESLLNQMYEYQPDRGTGGVLTGDEVEKVDVYKKKG